MIICIKIEYATVNETLYLLESIKKRLFKIEANNTEDLAPEILTICDFIKQIKNEKELPH
jgi:hypothetical protein